MVYGLDAYLKGLDDQEAAFGAACWKAAKDAGLTETQAEQCDNFEHCCAGCPWKKDWSEK
jgi:hypothetical protein